MQSAHLDSSHKDVYFARDKGHPAFKPSFLNSYVFLDDTRVDNWHIVNVKEGYIVTLTKEKNDQVRQIHRGNVKVIRDTFGGRSETYTTR